MVFVEYVVIGEEIDSGLTVQKDVGSRGGIVRLVEGFISSTMLGDFNLVFLQIDLDFFQPFLYINGIWMWSGEVDPWLVIEVWYDVEFKSIIETTSIGVGIYAIYQASCIFNVIFIITTIIDRGLNSLPLVLEAVFATVLCVEGTKLAVILSTDILLFSSLSTSFLSVALLGKGEVIIVGSYNLEDVLGVMLPVWHEVLHVLDDTEVSICGLV